MYAFLIGLMLFAIGFASNALGQAGPTVGPCDIEQKSCAKAVSFSYEPCNCRPQRLQLKPNQYLDHPRTIGDHSHSIVPGGFEVRS